MQDELTIVIPAYNEEKSIRSTISQCRKYCPDSSILVIDDGSDDETAKIGSGLARKDKRLRIISAKKNQGYGASLIKGFEEAKTQYVAFLDADLTYHPKYLPEMLSILREKDLGCIWGSRFQMQSRMPLIRRIGNRILIILFFIITGRKVQDVSSGQRILTRDALRQIDFKTLPKGLDMITAMTKRIVSRRIRYQIIPVEYAKRSGSSKLNILMDFLRISRNIVMVK